MGRFECHNWSSLRNSNLTIFIIMNHYFIQNIFMFLREIKKY